MKVIDIVNDKNNGNVRVIVRRVDPFREVDSEVEYLYDGLLYDMPDDLMDLPVMSTGWSFGNNCPVIECPRVYKFSVTL